MTIIPILLYHSVSQEPEQWIARFAVSPDTFAEHVELIANSGRTPMTVSDLCAAMRGLRPLPPRPVAITFDDGFADFFDAATLLATHHIPSTLYVTTGALAGRGGRPPEMALPPAHMLDWSQLPELADLNVEIGAHSHTHRQLDTMSAATVSDEIRRSKAMLEDALGREAPSFAYPHGFNNAQTRRAVKAVGHSSACAVMNALSSASDDTFSLARLTVGAATTTEQIGAGLAGRGARIAPYPEKLRTKIWRLYRRARRTQSASGIGRNGR